MAQFAVDAFAGASGTELAAYDAAWSLQTGYTVVSIITPDARARTNGGSATTCYKHSGVPATADYSVNLDLYRWATAGAVYALGPTARASTTANTFYMARNLNAADIQLYKCVAGVFTQLGSNVAATLAESTATNIKLEAIGTALKVYWNLSGTAGISQTDSAITDAGKAGFYIYAGGTAGSSSGVHVDNFSADDAAGSGISGTIAVTLDAFTSAITGTTTVTGTMAVTLANATSAMTGTPTVPGTMAANVDNFTSNMSGSTNPVGTMAAVMEAFTSAIAGTTTVVGTMAVTLANFTSDMYDVLSAAVSSWIQYCRRHGRR